MHDSSLPTSFLLFLLVASLIVVEFAVGPPCTTAPIVLAAAAGKVTPATASSSPSCSLLDEEEWTRDKEEEEEEDSIHRGTAAAAENHADDVLPSRSMMMRLGREGCGRSFRLLTQEEQEQQQEEEENGNVDAAESRRRRSATTTSALWDERSRCRCLTHLRSRFWTPLFFDEEGITTNELNDNKNNVDDNNNKIPPAAPYETQFEEEQSSSSSPTKREAESKGRSRRSVSMGWESLLSFASIPERNGASSTKRVSTSLSKFFETCWETAACVRRGRSARAEPTTTATTTFDEVEGEKTAEENKKGSPKEHHHHHLSLGETSWDAALRESPHFSNATSLEEWSSRTTGTWLLEELSIAKLRECRHRRDDTGARRQSSSSTTTDTSKGSKEEVPTTETCHVEYEHLSSLPPNYFGTPSRRSSSSSERMPEQQTTKGTPLTKAAAAAGPPPPWKLSPAAESILGSAQPQEDIVVDDGYDVSSSTLSFSSPPSPDGPSSSTDENDKSKKARPQPHSSLMYVTQEISQFEATRHSRSSTSGGFVSFAQHTNRTLIVRDADGRHPFLRDVSLALQYGVLGGVSEVGVSVYFTPLPVPATTTTTTADEQTQPQQQQQHRGPGPTEVKSTVPPHIDAMDVFVYQVAGYKQWSLQQPHEAFELPMQPVPLPLHAKHYHHHHRDRNRRNRRRRHAGGAAAGKDEKDVGAQVVHVVLGPGDWLYIPRGMIHNTTAVEGPQGSRYRRRSSEFKPSSDHADKDHHRDAVVVEDHGSIHFSFGIDPKGERVPDRGFTWLGFAMWLASTRPSSFPSSPSSPFLGDEELLQADDDDKNEETPLRVAFESLLFSPQHRERPSPAALLFLLPEAAETFCRPLRRLVVPPHVMSLQAQLQRVEESLRTFLTLEEKPQSKRKPTTTASALVVLQRWRRLLQTSSSFKHLHTQPGDQLRETLDAAARFFQRLSCAVAVLENLAQQATDNKGVGVAARSPSSLSSSESLAAPVECEADVGANQRATLLRDLLLRMRLSQPQQRAVVVEEVGGQSSHLSTFARTASTTKPSPQTTVACDEADEDLHGVDLCSLQHPPQQTPTSDLDVVAVGLATLYETVFADLLHMLQPPAATQHRASPDGKQPSRTEADADHASTKQSRIKTTPVTTTASSTRLKQRWKAWRKEASQRSLEERYAFAEWEWINSYLLYFSSTP